MEEENGVKAPVTRLRRRLSVEQSDDVKSPGPATPTKKRGGRLAAKPQLDLIEEIASTPGSANKRSTRKTSAKEIAEAEEKPVTPSRRSTRIKSNTSIVSESTQSYDSPRAKRAARRTSQVGSDSESSLTPARATRRTRKDSASSVEKLETTLASKPSNITEVIIEETESSSIKSDDTTKGNENTTEITPTRRSPRLKGKKQTVKNLRKSIDKNNDETEGLNNSSSKGEFNDSKLNNKSEAVAEVPKVVENKNISSLEKHTEIDTDSSLLLVKELEEKPRNNRSNLNKSTSALDSTSFKSKRQRTKSWTITTHTQVDEGMFYSDNERVKKRFSKKLTLKESKTESIHMGSGDHVLDNTENEKSIVQSTDEKSQHNTSVQKDTQNESSFSKTKARTSKGFVTPNKSLNTSNSALDAKTISPEGNKETILEEPSESTIFFEKGPTTLLQSTVLFEDSDTDSKGKDKKIKSNTEDQCVPVVDNKLVEEQVTETSENDNKSKNNSVLNKTNNKNLDDDGCEPMDIDETIPNNISITELSRDNTSDNKVPKVKEQSVKHSPLFDNSLNISSNKSRRKSSITISTNPNLEKTENENKSTLILSQIKDISSTEHNTSKSPKASNELLSKSVCSASIVKDKALDKKNLSQDYSTSTPLQQKKIQKLGMQINSSIIDTSVVESKNAQNKSETEVSQSSSEDDSEDEVDSSKPRNSLLDDEAEVASDNYESGDSQDDDERQYEKDNEIVEKGETLDSDEDVSNDTDYEKDSFIVSSAEEDNDFLSGTGDDLSMSDNELTMSKKSKDKFNERKLKDQKKASREMYEARHKLDTSKASFKSKKSNRQKIESSEESSEEEIIAPVKRNKLRLDSTQDESLNKSNAKDSKIIKNSKRKRLSESMCDENANTEHEITVYGDNLQNPDPLSVQIKLEPKTPMKDMDISTVTINENIEEVCVENNVSVMKTSETIDPLQATMLEEDSSSISENSDIMNNYDSVLKELNNDKPKTLKSLDMSLNPNKKTKQKTHPIIDQLNITNSKKSKKNKTPLGKYVVDSAQSNEPPNIEYSPANASKESSSADSIDLQLLFSEDSNDFDASQKSLKNKETQDTGETENFIPLKRTPGKMNILTTESEHIYLSDNIEPTESQLLNESIKNNKRKSKSTIEEKTDTQGANERINKSLNIPLNTSTKKKKVKRQNVTLNDGELSSLDVSTRNKEEIMSDEDTRIEKETPQVTNKDEDALEEVVNTKNKKKNRISSETRLEDDLPKDTNDDDGPEEISYKSTKNKKKNRETSEMYLEEETSKDEVAEKSVNFSLNENSGKKKKKRNSESQNANISDVQENAEKSIDCSLTADITKKNKNKKLSITLENKDIEPPLNNTEETLEISKKRKRKSSANQENDNVNFEDQIPKNVDEFIIFGSQKKKRKISQNDDYVQITDQIINKGQLKQNLDLEPKKKNKKRKERDDDDGNKITKIFKENVFDNVHISRLPTSIINQLDDKPRKEILEIKKSSVVSTTPFVVEDIRRRKNKPSTFLEETVCLNDTHIEKKKKANIRNCKVLPFIPTALTSASGFTTNFKIHVIPQEVQFVAKSKNVANFKNDYLYGKKIKRLGTYETYKRHRSAKMSKF